MVQTNFFAEKRLSRIFPNGEAVLHLPLEPDSRYVLFSDCHRGSGNANDNFLKNEALYLAALNHYFQKGFTYIELGDGDELWENRSMTPIKEMHPEVFRLLAHFYEEHRLHLLYGNHDMVKRSSKTDFASFYCDHSFCSRPLCPGIHFYEGILLHENVSGKTLCLTHGHQAEALNSSLWRLSRFLVRYFWKPLESLGIPDPTSAAKNNTRKRRTEETLINWAKKHSCILIAGHTHRPMLNLKEAPYVNTESCIHPSGITCLEIEGSRLSLVKWQFSAGNELILRASRNVLKSEFISE